MYWLLALMTGSLLGIITAGIYFDIRPLPAGANAKRWLKSGVALNLLLFVGAQFGLLALGIQDVMAQPEAAEGMREISVGLGLAIIGIGIPTADREMPPPKNGTRIANAFSPTTTQRHI